MKTIRQAVADAAQRLHGENAARDAELLLMYALGLTRASLLANPQRELTSEEAARFDALIAERAMGKPIQYITGVQEFYGLEFAVTPDVLIPRPETEHLVEAVIAHLPKDRVVKIADVGTGSGAIAVSLAHELPLARVVALDISCAALDVAARNANTHGVDGRIQIMESDLLNACSGQRFDAIVSNPPYIADGEKLEAQVNDFEPALALFGGATGYEMYGRLIPEAWHALSEGGLLAMEMGFGQAERIRAMLTGWNDVEVVDDLQSIPRVVLARKPQM